MTQLCVIAVGRMKAGPLAELSKTYLKRLAPAGLGAVRLLEVEARLQPTSELRKEREAESITARIPDGAVLVALDERGKTLSSPDFAAWIARQQGSGVGHVAFAIGGADGLANGFTQRAQLVLGLGAMTWPHMLARVMLLEQLYRAQQILAGHPYHRE